MRLLVIRTSAMGDVALTLPAIKAMRTGYPNVRITFVTRPAFSPFFLSVDGVDFFYPDLDGRHKGFFGIFRLFNDIRKTAKIDRVIDLHDVLRSKVLRSLFAMTGVRSTVINKGRAEKKLSIQGKNRNTLRHSVERYSDVFAAAGFDLELSHGPWLIPGEKALRNIIPMTGNQGTFNIGIAPFAMHKLKVWPEESMKELIDMIASEFPANFWFFGGNDDKGKLENLQKAVPGSLSLAGKLTLDEELAMMSRLDLMIAMDSSNMHMAALCGTKVVSVWGGTDPVCGFGAWMQPKYYSVKIPFEELECRPCTIYGKGECRRGDFACMTRLTPTMVFARIRKILGSKE